MPLFSHLYQRVLHWSKHPKASYLLAGVSFAESSFFPIPPDVMLISMGLARRQRVWFYALLTTFFSVIGGIAGYLIGALFIEFAMRMIDTYGLMSNYHLLQQWFLHWGVLIVLVAGFTPIPYKLFTITAGTMHMALLPFILASLLGRGGRFFLVSAAIYLGGEKLEQKLHRYIEPIGWGIVLLLAVVMAVKLLSH